MRVTPNQCLVGDALNVLATWPPDFIDTVITSPPYHLLRNYGVAGQIGMEPDVHGWVEHVVEVMRQVQRVLKPTGSLWLNVGDAYSRHERYGAARKSLLLGPERLLLALAGDGWIVRNKVSWSKPNPRPASVRDRLTCSWEPVFFLTKSPVYYFDLDAIRLPHQSKTRRTSSAPSSNGIPVWAGPLAGTQEGLARLRSEGRPGHPLGKNPGDSWQIVATGYRGAHFATFPERLVEVPLLATCPEGVCQRCNQPWQRPPARHLGSLAIRQRVRPACRCRARSRPGLVLDPFFGTGTVAIVAERLGRRWLGIELNPDFVALSEARLAAGGTRQAVRAA